MQLLFKNRYFALIWVALTLFTAAAFVGDGGGQEKIDDAAKRLQQQHNELETPTNGQTFADEEEEEAPVDPDLALQPDGDDPQIMNGPNGERYRVLTQDEAARVTGEGEAEAEAEQ